MIRTKKFFSVLLALVMVLALLPVGAAHATDDTTPTTYTVSFDSDGGSAVEEQKVAAGEKATEPEDPTKEGYTFDYWQTEDGTEFDFNSAINADTRLKAKWTENKPATFTVTFDSDGGSAVEEQKVAAGEKATEPEDPTKEGFTFDSWLKEDETAFDFNSAITANITLKAKWTAQEAPAEEDSFTVTFAAGEGTGSMADVKVKKGEKLTLPENGFKAPTGKEFDSWDLLGKPAKPGDEVDITANTTVKATWKWLSYTVTFDSDGGSSVAPQTVTIGGKATKPTDPTKEGYTFDSWQTPQGAAFDFGSPVEADITLKAKWTEKKPDTFTVSFETNGGSAVEKQTVEKGKTAANPTAPTRKGYSFSGWYSDKDLKTAYDFTSAVTADVTLYAKWTEIKYTVSAGANGYYTLKSNKTVSITVKRSEADDTCLNHFSSVEIDGKTLTKDTDYTVKSGSTVVSFKPETLEKLAKGGHTVTVNFDDGKAETKLTIYAEGHSPKTGDENNLALWGALAAVCVLGAAGGLILLTKKKRTDK